MKIFNNLPKLSSEDTANSIVTYESMDNADVTSWTDVDVIESGEKHHSLFKKISTMFKNIRYLFKTLGTTDISAIGDGTVTGGLSKINNDLGIKINNKHFMLLGNLTIPNQNGGILRNPDTSILEYMPIGTCCGTPYSQKRSNQFQVAMDTTNGTLYAMDAPEALYGQPCIVFMVKNEAF